MEGRFRFYGLAIKQDLQKAAQTTGRNTGPTVARVHPQGNYLGVIRGNDPPSHLASKVSQVLHIPTSGPFRAEQGVTGLWAVRVSASTSLWTALTSTVGRPEK